MYQINNLKYRGVIDINKLEISKGKVYIVSGPSGSGKSSLINLLMANDYKYEGEVHYNGELLKNIDSMKIKKKVITLGQESVLLGKTIEEDFKVLCELLEVKYDLKSVNQCLKLAALDIDLNEKTHKLSGGQKQRLFIARTLYIERETYIFDEPTSALDPETSEIVMDNIYRFAHENNKLCIIISHNQSVINDERYEHILLGEAK